MNGEKSKIPDYSIRESTRARRVSIRITPGEGLEVVIPKGFDRDRAAAFVAEKRELIQKAFKRLEEQGYSFDTDLLLPDTIHFEAVNERYTVIYRKTHSREAVLTGNQNELLVPENKVNSNWCHSILKVWLQKQGRLHLVPWLRKLSDETGLEYKKVQVRNQKGRWGSCSTTGTISLNCKLLFLSPEQVDYLMIHELCHLRYRGHFPEFWRFVEKLRPDFKFQEAQLKEAGKKIPAWAR